MAQIGVSPGNRRPLVFPSIRHVVPTLGPQRHGPNVPVCLEETRRRHSHRASWKLIGSPCPRPCAAVGGGLGLVRAPANSQLGIAGGTVKWAAALDSSLQPLKVAQGHHVAQPATFPKK